MEGKAKKGLSFVSLMLKEPDKASAHLVSIKDRQIK